MAEESSVPLTVAAKTTLLRQVPASTLHWDSRSGACHDLGPQVLTKHERLSSFQAQGRLSAEWRGQRYWKTSEIRLVPTVSFQGVIWEQEAELATFFLDPMYLRHHTDEGILGATGELVWIPWKEHPASSTPSVYPALLIHTPYESLLGEYVELVPSLQIPDLLLNHIALVLQAVLKNKDVVGQLYAEVLGNALAIHFLRRYSASRLSLREVTGGLSPYKLQRTTTYIKDHLEHELPLTTLAAVGETSPAHFARLFKRATGLAPHQYVIRCRMEQAKKLLVETDISLSEIGFQIGCADQSHFTALFRKYVSMTPKIYREKIKISSASERSCEPDITENWNNSQLD